MKKTEEDGTGCCFWFVGLLAAAASVLVTTSGPRGTRQSLRTTSNNTRSSYLAVCLVRTQSGSGDRLKRIAWTKG